MKQTIGIIGCGWLGFPLAVSLVNDGFRVKGTTTSLEKQTQLTEQGIEAYQLTLTEHAVLGDWDNFIAEIDCLLLNIPPRLRGNSEESYASKVVQLLKKLEHHRTLKIIWVSSTSVFSDGQGLLVDTTIPQPETASGNELLAAEQNIRCSGHPFTIVRFGGLIGPNRHPISHLSGRKNIERAHAPVNLIALEDCIGILKECIQRDALQDSINAVYPEHPSRKDFYTQAALERNLPLPEFDPADERMGKQIQPKFLLETWNYVFQVKP
ncbi:MAG: Protein YeeZ [Bacteroidota bacterium]|jgi:nucleoside-diphosphate-sugar epimerase